MLAAQTRKQPVFNIKGALKTLRRGWRRGTFTDFDSLLMQILGCSRETAERIRESWLDLDLLGYDREGYLVWCDGWMDEKVKTKGVKKVGVDPYKHSTFSKPRCCRDCEEATIHQTGSQLWVSCRFRDGWRSIDSQCVVVEKKRRP